MALEVLAAHRIEGVVDVVAAVGARAEHTAQGAHAPLAQDGQAGRRAHAPVQHGGQSVGFLAGKAVNLARHQVEVVGQPGWRGVLVGPVGELRERVEGQLQPLAVLAPLGLVAVGEVGQRKVVLRRGMEHVDGELGAVLAVQPAQAIEVEAVEERGGPAAGQIAQEEAVVVDAEAVALLRPAVPEHANAVRTGPCRALLGGADLGPGCRQVDVGRERVAGACRRVAIHQDEGARRSVSPDPEGQAMRVLATVPMAQHRAMNRIIDVDHGNLPRRPTAPVGSRRSVRPPAESAGRWHRPAVAPSATARRRYGRRSQRVPGR